MDRLTAEEIERSRSELSELERRFLERVAQTNRCKNAGVNKGAKDAAGSSFSADMIRPQPHGQVRAATLCPCFRVLAAPCLLSVLCGSTLPPRSPFFAPAFTSRALRRTVHSRSARICVSCASVHVQMFGSQAVMAPWMMPPQQATPMPSLSSYTGGAGATGANGEGTAGGFGAGVPGEAGAEAPGYHGPGPQQSYHGGPGGEDRETRPLVPSNSLDALAAGLPGVSPPE